MTQPTTHPLDVANLLVPALSGVVGALSDRGGSSIAEYDARAEESWRLIQSFRPRNSMDLMLAGQLVEFHEILADGTRDLLRGMTEPLKHRTRSSLVAIGRLCLGYADRLDKRALEAHRAEGAIPSTEQLAKPAAQRDAATPDRGPVAIGPAAVSEAVVFNQPDAAAEANALAGLADATGDRPTVAATSQRDDPSPEPLTKPAPTLAAPTLAAPALAAQASAALQALAAAKAVVPASASAPAKVPVMRPGVKGWYVDVGAPSMESADAKMFPPLPSDAMTRERNGAAGGD